MYSNIYNNGLNCKLNNGRHNLVT